MNFSSDQGMVFPDHTRETETMRPQAYETDMASADRYYDLGIRMSEQGKPGDAIACYLKAVEINPADADAYYNMALAFNLIGNLEEALSCYRKVLAINPEDAQACNNLGVVLNNLGKTEEAVSCYRQAIHLNPAHAQAYNNLGNALQFQGKSDEAVSCYLRSLEINPDNAEVYNNLGIILEKQGRMTEAVSCFRKAIGINPAHARAYNHLGSTFRAQGKPFEAIDFHKRALEIRPDYANAHYNMGNAYRDLGDQGKAVCCYRKAIELEPNHSRACFNLANVLKDQGKTDEAIRKYQRVVDIDPEMVEAARIMGFLLSDQGKPGEAFDAYQMALSIRPDPGLQTRAALVLPVICESTDSIYRSRQTLLERLHELEHKGIRLDDPLKQVGVTTFLLAYHGLNDRKIQERMASFYIGACPELQWTSPHCRAPERSGGKIRIGVISRFLYGHTIGQLFHGMIRHLSREKFHVTVFRFEGTEDALSRAIDQSADEVVSLPCELEPARLEISSHEPDILFYLDIGMDPMTYFLAFSRLAPVQCKRAHPVTSGIPNIDYFLSPDKAETPESDDHYSEQLFRLKTYGYYYYRPGFATQNPNRDRFGLPKDRRLYICPQSLFKFHPDYDDMFGAILRQDPHGLLILIEGRHPHWKKLLLDRFAQSFPDVVDRVRFLPRMPHPDFLSLFQIADAVLDTPVFCGGKTSLDCFSFGIPIVTLPGRFMRGRLTLAQYEEMGFLDCVAESRHDFVDIATRLANDEKWRNELKEKISLCSHVLFENMAAVRELESFFEQAVQKTLSATNQRLS